MPYIKRKGRWFIKAERMNYDWGNDEMARMLKIGPYHPELQTPPSPPNDGR